MSHEPLSALGLAVALLVDRMTKDAPEKTLMEILEQIIQDRPVLDLTAIAKQTVRVNDLVVIASPVDDNCARLALLAILPRDGAILFTAKDFSLSEIVFGLASPVAPAAASLAYALEAKWPHFRRAARDLHGDAS